MGYRGSDGTRPKGSAKRLVMWAQRLNVHPHYLWRLRVAGVAETSVLFTWDAGARDAGEQWGADVIDAAQDDADTRMSFMEYRLELVEPSEERDDRVLGTYNIRRKPRDSADGSDLEGPSAEGQIQQQMRHVEALMRSNAEMQRQAFSALGAVLERYDKRAAVMEKTMHEALATYVEAVKALAQVGDAAVDKEVELKKQGRLDRLVEMGEALVLQHLTAGGTGTTSTGEH